MKNKLLQCVDYYEMFIHILLNIDKIIIMKWKLFHRHLADVILINNQL